ncbi:MAG: phosphoheptose isomerase, partial [Thermodesulfobacteriota bacterium]
MIPWSENVSDLRKNLERLSATDGLGAPVNVDLGLARWMDRTERIRSTGKKVHLIGNGASASMASHFAA